jgi:hypothetical protein
MTQPPGPRPQPGEPYHPYQPHEPHQPHQAPAAPPGYPYRSPGERALAGLPPHPRKKRTLLITSIVLAVVILLCGGGGTAAYFLVRSVDGKGQATPQEAVDGFLTAVFKEKDVDKATMYVCSASRDKASLTKKINELRAYQQKYRSAQFTWPDPTVDEQSKSTATLTVPVKFTTDDDRVAERKLRFTTVNESGWWVCEVGDAG